MSDNSLTPMMKQYHAIRRELPPDVLLFFRLGDFYELFFEDAKTAAPILNVALTKRNEIPMCGIPFHAAQGYIARLIQAEKRVAIAEQTSEPQPGKLVERQLSQIITASTFDQDNLLDAGRSQYLAAIYQEGKKWGLAWADLTTGDFRLAEFTTAAPLCDEIHRLAPREILASTAQIPLLRKLLGENTILQETDSYCFLPEQAQHLLLTHFQTHSLDGFGCQNMSSAIGAAGAVLHYLQYQLRRKVDHFRRLQVSDQGSHVLIDAASQINLEIVQNRSDGRSLLKTLDRTRTPMGARLLRDWLLHPLRDLPTLLDRQALIGAFVEDPLTLHQIRDTLSAVRDVERTLGRLTQGNGNARDLLILGQSLSRTQILRQLLQSQESLAPLAGKITAYLHDFTDFTGYLHAALAEEPPATIKEGGIFKPGFLPLLDELREASRSGKQWIADLQAREIERTGIKSLKIRHNAVFGYYIEITKSNLANVPEDYTRRQTTANAERFVTPELRAMEEKILGADEKSKALEMEEFLKLRDLVLEHTNAIQETAAAFAQADVIASMAETARLFGHVRPVLNETKNLIIRDGRHPVLDQNIAGDKFVPNDTYLEPRENRLMIITGPNMAGKSTYIRQVALLTLMAQTGAFIPASQAEIGLVDRIFTRVGANDDLSRGQSTFMVEMNETAMIVNNATDKSLVILDEIGRGTSTFDGLSIAWSVAEYLHDTIGARTLFATHYHELTQLSRTRKGVQNYNVAVREWNEQIIFLRKILAGAADKSYGIQVARLAGLPQEVLSRAHEILNTLETGRPLQPEVAEASPAIAPTKRGKKTGDRIQETEPQLSLW